MRGSRQPIIDLFTFFLLFFTFFFLRKLVSSHLDSIDTCIHAHRGTFRPSPDHDTLFQTLLCRASSNPSFPSVFTLYTAKHMRLGSIRYPITHTLYGPYPPSHGPDTPSSNFMPPLPPPLRQSFTPEHPHHIRYAHGYRRTHTYIHMQDGVSSPMLRSQV